jgi:hypothetical protein
MYEKNESVVENKHATDFSGLLTEAISLLLTDEHPDEMDTAFMRFRGYERMSGMVYQELVKSMRLMRSKSTKASRVLDLNPQAVFRAIQLDTSVMPIKEINPIEELKDQESVTFSGTGGRTGRTMPGKSRKYHRNSMGVASEATPDNGDVGVNFYLSANPQVDSVLGTTKRYEKGVTGNSSMVSTSVLLAPASDKDQARRANFISIQNSHTVPCSGYEVVPFRTGYEQVVPYRVSDLYCVIAPQDGVVLDVTDRVIKVEYKDKSVASYEIGKRFGEAAGMTIPHIVVTGWAKGKKFRADDVLTYHTGFFEKDPMNPGKVSMKFSALALSDVGIAMGGLGADAAIESADVVIQTDQPSKVATAISIGRATRRIVKQNIAGAIGVKSLILIAGACGFVTLWAAVFADVGVALLAVLNSVRILSKKLE